MLADAAPLELRILQTAQISVYYACHLRLVDLVLNGIRGGGLGLLGKFGCHQSLHFFDRARNLAIPKHRDQNLLQQLGGLALRSFNLRKADFSLDSVVPGNQRLAFSDPRTENAICRAPKPDVWCPVKKTRQRAHSAS